MTNRTVSVFDTVKGKCEWGSCPKRARRRDPSSGGYAESYYMNLCGEHYRERRDQRAEDMDVMDDMRGAGHFG